MLINWMRLARLVLPVLLRTVVRISNVCGHPVDGIDVAEWEMKGDDSEHTPVHEFIVKLSRIKDRLTTRSGRAIAEERHNYMQDFYQRLDAEVQGEK